MGDAGRVVNAGVMDTQDEGRPIAYRAALNFTGAGVLAANHPTIARTDVTIFTATPTQEGAVSVGTQDFNGLKTFHRGIVALNDTGGFAVPLIAKVGLGEYSGAHIQEWTTSAVLAWIDTQPTLRLRILGAGRLPELCSDGGAFTVKLAAGGAPTASYTLRFPNAPGSVGQVSPRSGRAVKRYGRRARPARETSRLRLRKGPI